MSQSQNIIITEEYPFINVSSTLIPDNMSPRTQKYNLNSLTPVPNSENLLYISGIQYQCQRILQSTLIVHMGLISMMITFTAVNIYD